MVLSVIGLFILHLFFEQLRMFWTQFISSEEKFGFVIRNISYGDAYAYDLEHHKSAWFLSYSIMYVITVQFGCIFC